MNILKKNKGEEKFPLRKGILSVLLFAFVLGIALISLFPHIRIHLIGSNLTGTLDVTVNGQEAVPYNITCITDTDKEEHLTLKKKESGMKIKASAVGYNGYIFEYDVDTEEEVKHFCFMVLKTHNFGPRIDFAYQMKLDKEDNEWIAKVWLDDKGTEGKVYTIPLSEDETAYVQMGP